MGKSLANFLADRKKFSPKKARAPIHKYDGDEMRSSKRCALHDGAHRECLGRGCRRFDARHALEGEEPKGEPKGSGLGAALLPAHDDIMNRGPSLRYSAPKDLLRSGWRDPASAPASSLGAAAGAWARAWRIF